MAGSLVYLIDNVAANLNSIGYLTLAEAGRVGLPLVSLVNSAGFVIAPTADSILFAGNVCVVCVILILVPVVVPVLVLALLSLILFSPSFMLRCSFVKPNQ